MRTIAIMNNKGGVGKTVTAINLADILVRDYGKRAVLADCDGQMNLTRFFLPEFEPEQGCTVADILSGTGEAMWEDNLTPLEPGLDLLPGSSDLYELDFMAIRDGVSRPGRLREFVQAAAEDGQTDFFILDCPPGYTVASVGALLAADEVVVPMLVDGFSFAGMRDLARQVESLRRDGAGTEIAGVLLTQWRNSEVVRQGEALIRSLGAPVFRQTIRRTDKVPESTFDRQPIVKYSPTSAASRDYRKWVEEYLGGELHGV